MVDLVLKDLSGPAGEGLGAGLEFFVLPLDLDGLEALGLSGAGEGETALLGLIRPGLFEDDRVEHDEIAVLALDGDDALCSADHVRRHADTAVFVGDERFQQILRDGQVFRGGRSGFPGEKKLVFADVTDHRKPPVQMKKATMCVILRRFIVAFLWSEWRDSNSRPPAPKAGALPTAQHPGGDT